MSLSTDLISQFVKTTKDTDNTKKESTLYGTVTNAEKKVVKLDGSDISTPVNSTVDFVDGDRVVVMIKNHNAVVTGNLTNPAARTVVVEEVIQTTSVTTDNLTAAIGRINTLETNSLTSESAVIKELQTNKLDSESALIKDLQTNKLSVEDAKILYANIDFANIGEAAIENLFSKSGIIEDIIMDNGTITGKLVGVTISGDLIEGNTIVAEKLVIQGEDGLYYKLNTDGMTIEAEQTNENSLDGSVIKAKSITATKVDVSDLVAFDATIGGFHISSNSIYSGVKESVDNTTSGIFMDNEGQISLGDGSNYLRYFKDENGDWKLEISAESVLFGANSKSSADDIKALTEHVKIGTYDNQPCVELSEGDSDFKQIITNDKTMFMDGPAVRTQIDTDGVTSDNITVNNELRQGGFVWVTRSNGHLSLVLKGGNS